jgi:hypothetical protein
MFLRFQKLSKIYEPECQHSVCLKAEIEGNRMRDMALGGKSPPVMRDEVSATALLLRQYFLALRSLERAPGAINTLEPVQKLLDGMEAARGSSLARVSFLPGRLDGVFFYKTIGRPN